MKKIITNKNILKDFLKYESKRYNLKNEKFPFFAFNENKLLYKFNYLLRHLEYYTNCNKKIRKKIVGAIFWHYQKKYLIFLPINVFDVGLRLIHIGQRLVNVNVTVGKDFIMHINTFIVAGGTNDCAPIIGDNVIMGVNSTILGKANIGNNTAIGAGSVVNKDFSEGYITIAGVPAKKISNNTREDWNKKQKKGK